MYHLYENCGNSTTYLTLIFSCSYANDMKNCLRDNHSRLNGVDYTKFEEVHPSRNNLSSIQGNRKLTFLHAQWKIYFSIPRRELFFCSTRPTTWRGRGARSFWILFQVVKEQEPRHAAGRHRAGPHKAPFWALGLEEGLEEAPLSRPRAAAWNSPRRTRGRPRNREAQTN